MFASPTTGVSGHCAGRIIKCKSARGEILSGVLKSSPLAAWFSPASPCLLAAVSSLWAFWVFSFTIQPREQQWPACPAPPPLCIQRGRGVLSTASTRCVSRVLNGHRRPMPVDLKHPEIYPGPCSCGSKSVCNLMGQKPRVPVVLHS